MADNSERSQKKIKRFKEIFWKYGRKLPEEHLAVTFSTNISKPSPVTTEVTYRKLKAINVELFRQDILLKVASIGEADTTVDQQFSAYNSGWSSRFNK